jgi:hypothetical protein
MSDANNNILLQEEKQDSKQYRRTLWWVENRGRLGKISVLSLIIFDVCLVLFVSWSMLDAFVLSASPERRAVIDSVLLNQEDLRAYSVARSASPLSAPNTQVFVSKENTYDFYAVLQNENKDWWAEYDYQFVFDTGTTEVRRGFILPESAKPVTELAFVSTTGMTNPRFQFLDVSWHRIDRHAIPDYVKWSQDRLGLEIQNPTITQDTTIDPGGLFRTAFTIRNGTAYSYYNPTFHLLLKRGSSVVAVNKTTLQSLVPGESQEIVVNWFGTVPSADQVEIIPDLNLFDPTLYKPLVGSATIDTR